MQAELLRQGVNLLRELKKKLGQIRYVVFTGVLQKESCMLHTSRLVFAAAEVVTESRTKRSVCESRKYEDMPTTSNSYVQSFI